MMKSHGASTSPTGLSSCGPSPAVSAVPASIPSAVIIALLAVVDAVRAYLPPDGIPPGEFINRVIGATDNPEINPFIRQLEGATSAQEVA